MGLKYLSLVESQILPTEPRLGMGRWVFDTKVKNALTAESCGCPGYAAALLINTQPDKTGMRLPPAFDIAVLSSIRLTQSTCIPCPAFPSTIFPLIVDPDAASIPMPPLWVKLAGLMPGRELLFRRPRHWRNCAPSMYRSSRHPSCSERTCFPQSHSWRCRTDMKNRTLD